MKFSYDTNIDEYAAGSYNSDTQELEFAFFSKADISNGLSKQRKPHHTPTTRTTHTCTHPSHSHLFQVMQRPLRAAHCLWRLCQ